MLDPFLRLKTPADCVWDAKLVCPVHQITWTTEDPEQVPEVTIEYSIDREKTWIPIAVSIPNAASDTFDWTVPGTSSDYCFVRVRGSEKDDDPSDTSDSAFSILPWEGLLLLSPNGGETIRAWNFYTITWTSTGAFDTVVLEYSLNGGELWFVLTDTAADTGEYDWQVPALSSSNCLVRISGVLSDSDAEVSDTSDSFFAIVEN